MDFKHIPVMLEETLELLCIKDNGLYIDGTLGGAGHARGILSAGKDVRLLGIDRDGEALAAAAAAPSHRSDSSSKLPIPCSVRKFNVSAARFKFSIVAQCL